MVSGARWNLLAGRSIIHVPFVKANLTLVLCNRMFKPPRLNGTGAFKDDGANPNLRAVFSVHPEPMHLMARADAGIATINDLKGKKVNIANPGSGTRVLAETLMKYHRITADDLALAAELKSSEQSAALCDGKIDATIWAAGLPNGSSQEATSTCDVKIINLKGTRY